MGKALANLPKYFISEKQGRKKFFFKLPLLLTSIIYNC